MDSIAPITESKLAAPGAGLPALELKIARFGFRLLSRTTTRKKSSALLAKGCAAILAQARPMSNDAGSKRILIKRLRGLEDSSRYWSVFMTLDHLRIVNLGVADTIRLLGQAKVPERKADTAAVKPSPNAGRDVIDEFELSCKLVERCASRLTDLRTEARFDHPWFGPLDAAAWYFLSGFHLRLHRKQVEMIIRQLPIKI